MDQLTIEEWKTSKVGLKMNNVSWLNLSRVQGSLIDRKSPASLRCYCCNVEKLSVAGKKRHGARSDSPLSRRF